MATNVSRASPGSLSPAERQNRRSGMVFDDVDILGEQTANDKQMMKDTMQELNADLDPCSRSDLNDDEAKSHSLQRANTSPVRPPRPSKPPSRSPLKLASVGTMSMEELEHEYNDIAKHKVFQLAGDDLSGRPVIAFSACRLPPKTTIDHQRLLSFLKQTLDQYVENDYTIVYFHYGLNSGNKPSFSFLRQVYHELDRKYKKNLKALYIVHPSNFVKLVFGLLSPWISSKFARKLNQVHRLDDLAPHLHLEQLDIPKAVRDHDDRVLARSKPKALPAQSVFHTTLDIEKTKQFGVSLQDLRVKNNGELIPPLMTQCIEFLRSHGLDVEGIFRRSALSALVKEVTDKYNLGQEVVFSEDDVHAPAVIIKKFLRELPEPIMTYHLYDRLMDLSTLPVEKKIEEIKDMLLNDFPEENYATLKYLCVFLQEVMDHTSSNKMTSSNLAIVFGPNLIWSTNAATSLTSMAKINSYAKVLFDHVKEIFPSTD